MKKLLLILLSTISLFAYAQEAEKSEAPKAEVKEEQSQKAELKPEEVAVKFFEDIFAGKADAVINYVHIPELEKASEQEKQMLTMFMGQMFAALKEEMQKQGEEVVGFKTNGVVYNADKTEAEVQLVAQRKTKDGKTKEDSQPMKLKKINGEWKIIME